MRKKIVFLMSLFFLVVVGLQIFGDRDFSQLLIAVDKYQHGGNTSALLSDIGDIFSGKTINEGGLATAKMAEHLIYRWIDDQGTVHLTERAPKDRKYEVMKMGDMSIETQKALDEEEIKKALKK